MPMYYSNNRVYFLPRPYVACVSPPLHGMTNPSMHRTGCLNCMQVLKDAYWFLRTIYFEVKKMAQIYGNFCLKILA